MKCAALILPLALAVLPLSGQPAPAPTAAADLLTYEDRDGSEVSESYTYFKAPDPLPAGWVKEYGKVKHGLARTFFPGNKLHEEIVYDHGVPQAWKRWRRDGSLMFTAEGKMQSIDEGYAVAIADGRAEWRTETGGVQVVNLFAGGRPQRVEVYYDDGKLENLFVFTGEAGRLQGTIEAHHPNGQVSMRGAFTGEAPERIVVNASLFYLPPFDAFQRTGPWKFFHENGQVANAGDYDEQGHKRGLWKRWRETGTPSREETFAADRLHGPARLFRESGELQSEGGYRDNEKDGEWRNYAEGGKLESTEVWSAGSLVETRPTPAAGT
jgi:antitoxin component YwqK of YwqJK toxin-antitoxin module